MKIVITTSDRYAHVIPIFCYLFNKYWSQPFELVGYTKPDNLPDNCTFHSMGKQGIVNEFTDDLIRYFEQQDEIFIWMMEDTFLKKPVDLGIVEKLIDLMKKDPSIGRISLSADSIKYYTELYGLLPHGPEIYATPRDSDYRLSTQLAIWNKKYLLKWMTPNHSPWQFENLKGTLMQRPDTEFSNLALDKFHAPVCHNEGVRKRDLYQYDLNGMSDEDIQYINSLR